MWLKCVCGRFCPDLAGGAYSAPPDPLAGFKWPTSKGREGHEGEQREGERKGKRGRDKGSYRYFEP